MESKKWTVAVRHYDRTLALHAGMIDTQDIQWKSFVTKGPRPVAEIWETNLWGLILSRFKGEPRIGIPIFPRRVFPNSVIFVNTNNKVHSPEDLVGKRVGVNFYQGTPPTLVRGILQDEFGIQPQQIGCWVPGGKELIPFLSGRPPSGINIELPPDGETPVTMLVNGQLDALISPNIPIR